MAYLGIGGPGRDRTDDLFHAMEARSQLRHRPIHTECSSILTHEACLVKLLALRPEWRQFAKAVKMGMLTRRTPNMNRRLPALAALLMFAGVSLGQAPPAPPVSYTSISELNQLLAGLQQASHTI